MKNLHFGEGLERSRSRSAGRFTVLVLIASLGAFLLWLLGTAAERAGIDRRLHPGNGKRRVYSRHFLARLLCALESCRPVLDELIPTVDLPGQWVANDHDALLADGVGGGEFVGIPQGWSTFAMVQRYAHLAPEHLAEHASRIEVGLKVTDLNHQKI